MRFHRRRTIPLYRLGAGGSAEREVGGNDVVLIILIVCKVIGVMFDMVVVISAGTRRATGA